MPADSFWVRAAFGLYRGLGSVIYPFAGPLLRARAKRGKEDRSRRSERYGYASDERPNGPLVWFHAASVGESLAILPLAERIDGYGINVVLTTGTVTSAEIVSRRASARIIHQYVPLDMKRSVERFLDHWKPDLAIFAESELWPLTNTMLSERNIPQILVNARMSDRSLKNWSKRKKIARAIFGNLRQVVAQSPIDGERFTRLGAPYVTVSGNLKNDLRAPEFDEAEFERLGIEIGSRPVWVAVSTHPGEELICARVHARLKRVLPDVLTIVVPRHPDRSDGILTELQTTGLNVSRRGSGDTIGAKTDVFLGDTIGEMGLYLKLARVAFMGKSLAGEGGQNPIEPALVDVAILTGRYVQNFRETFQTLVEANGAQLVRDEEMLATRVAQLLTNESERRAMTAAAREVVEAMTGALDRCSAALDPYITPLRVDATIAARQRQSASAKPAA